MLEFFQTLSWAAVFQIILIDILLGGDNAVVIALACRNLQPRQRLQGILWGTAGAIGLRVVLVVFAFVSSRTEDAAIGHVPVKTAGIARDR